MKDTVTKIQLVFSSQMHLFFQAEKRKEKLCYF